MSTVFLNAKQVQELQSSLGILSMGLELVAGQLHPGTYEVLRRNIKTALALIHSDPTPHAVCSDLPEPRINT